MPATMGEAVETNASSSASPGPPSTIEFALGAKRLVRYNRMARSGDTDAAVLGKGGFGCVYRYALDTSFTPPSSVDLALSLCSANTRRHASVLESSPPTSLQKSRDQHYHSDTTTEIATTSSLIKPPSLVAVKLCRTPCSGSFDELQKTSLIDKKTRKLDMQDNSKSHVRIVRGEGRIFRYLQDSLQASSRSDDPPLVKLLANLSPTGSNKDPHLDAFESSVDEEDGPPTRLLVFEKLIELDTERTAQGWTKSKRTWSHERVEKVAFEVIQGLQFLHEHNVTHGDLKPSNLMLDPRTGVVKIIDLGASRRFVHLSNRDRNNRSAVEYLDRQAIERGRTPTRLAPELCEGLGSLTGSPYYMAPEILLQATRYVDASGRARSVLEDYEYDYPSFLSRELWPMYQIGLSDLRRGWGIRADIWSWACTVQALLLKTVEEHQRPSSSTISPYDFSFSRHRDEMLDPLYEKAEGEDDVPRFHQWCRLLPLLIVRIALEPVSLIAQAEGCSSALRLALKASLRHQDLRPTADELLHSLEAARPSPARNTNRRPLTGSSAAWRSTSSRDSPRRSHTLAAANEATASPQSAGSDLEAFRYTTPPLSQGPSGVSTPQHTCENASRSCLERTPSRDRKVHFETGSTESSFLAAKSRRSDASVVTGLEASDPVPQGFELVSPSPSQSRSPKPRSTTLGDAPRPSTANATLQTSPSLFRGFRQPGSDTGSVTRISAPRPSTSSTTVRDKVFALPGTAPLMDARGNGQCFRGLEASHQVGISASWKTTASSPRSFSKIVKRERGHGQWSTPSQPVAGGLNISWPLEGMRNLQLNSPGPALYKAEGVRSMPSSPITHTRGASMPFLGLQDQAGTPLRMPPPAALASTMRQDNHDIGGSPRCFTSEIGASKQNSLMATLKEKQVRLKQSSRKLMGKRGTGAQNRQGSGEVVAGSQLGDDGWVHTNEAESLGHGSMHHAYAGPLNNPVMATPDWNTRQELGGAMGHGASSRVAGDERSPSKPLLRRLLTWSTNS
ncbi:uncharacterized protein UBRO_04389 [Ustilago bromivora]|uniref:Protein kinase domain-containing protein n=1 Tax=Ustilago bromivora TaxID=307758 RepID=A0A1K0G3T6_9BASI|nr:uncharacterized protein UBRO_04389 [Ustilago bromivora]SYW82740.1 uncharacterized protein UBRO2_04862 [Ustilago bromivora]